MLNIKQLLKQATIIGASALGASAATVDQHQTQRFSLRTDKKDQKSLAKGTAAGIVCGTATAAVLYHPYAALLH